MFDYGYKFFIVHKSQTHSKQNQIRQPHHDFLISIVLNRLLFILCNIRVCSNSRTAASHNSTIKTHIVPQDVNCTI